MIDQNQRGKQAQAAQSAATMLSARQSNQDRLFSAGRPSPEKISSNQSMAGASASL